MKFNVATLFAAGKVYAKEHTRLMSAIGRSIEVLDLSVEPKIGDAR